MYVRAQFLRVAGRLVPDHELDRARVVEGFLAGNGRRFQLHRPLEEPKGPLAELFDGRVTLITQFRLVIRGLEECRGAAVLQEWDCEVLNWYGCTRGGAPLPGPQPGSVEPVP